MKLQVGRSSVQSAVKLQEDRSSVRSAVKLQEFSTVCGEASGVQYGLR